MKHIFILNPVAGKGKAERLYLSEIHSIAKELKLKYEIHRTINIKDGERYVRNQCINRKDDEIYRFYACGGDGTLNEVVNGSIGFKNVEVGFIPSGTGNDFGRNFDNYKDFNDIKRQLLGKGYAVDILKIHKDKKEPRYCINMINIGFDCNAAEKMEELRNNPYISGTGAYITGVGLALFKKKTIGLKISIEEDKEHLDGRFLMMSVGNGKYSGGGFKGLFKASVSDGIMDVAIVKDISRTKIIRMIGRYKKGTLLETKLGNQVMEYRQCKKISIENQDAFCIAVDGEISKANNLDIEVVRNGLVFSVPV